MSGRGTSVRSRHTASSAIGPTRSSPTTDRESRCTVHIGGTRFASLHRLPTRVTFKIPRT
eukprot:709320-Pyramimonas_sp.AAC.1